MSGIAEVLINLGYSVQGSDLKVSPITKRLSSIGAKIFHQHASGNIGDCSVVVISSAIKKNNRE